MGENAHMQPCKDTAQQVAAKTRQQDD